MRLCQGQRKRYAALAPNRFDNIAVRRMGIGSQGCSPRQTGPEDQPEIRNRYRTQQPNLLPDKPTEIASRAQLPLNENPAAAGFTSECGLPLMGASTVAEAEPHQPKPE